MELTYWSAFAGIGGLDLGLDRAGFSPLLQCELDEFRASVLKEHWPDVPLVGDVRLLGAGAERRPTVLCGGFPCSDVSNASSTKTGVDGERSGLWVELLRLVRDVRPRYLLVENVAALLTRGLPRVLGDLAEVGYDAEWDCLPARAFCAPHRRDRIFVVAYAHCERCPRGARIYGTGRGPEPPLRRLVGGAGPGEAWPAEPRVARVDDGLSEPLDEGRVDAQEHGAAARAAGASGADGVRELRGNGGPGATPSGLRGAGSDRGALPDVSRRGGSAGRDAEEQAAEGLRGLRGDVHGLLAHEGKDLLAGLSARAREAQRAEAMGCWPPEPDIPRMMKGVPRRADRVEALGRAVVPRVAEHLGQLIRADAERRAGCDCW